MPTGDIGYTRAGSFHLNGEGALVTSEGYPRRAADSRFRRTPRRFRFRRTASCRSRFPARPPRSRSARSSSRRFRTPRASGPSAATSSCTTTASGEPQVGAAGEDARGTLAQGFIEDSNVSVVEEMVNMILGQRAYEANSKVIKAADEMLPQVNHDCSLAAACWLLLLTAPLVRRSDRASTSRPRWPPRIERPCARASGATSRRVGHEHHRRAPGRESASLRGRARSVSAHWQRRSGSCSRTATSAATQRESARRPPPFR